MTNLFVRKATGLVRSWSVFDAFIYALFSINLITLGLYSFSQMYYFGGGLVPALIVSALFIFFFRDGGKSVFWIGGIILSAAVGPAQASSRALLARVSPLGMQGEIFGLYATTGRVMSFLAPWLWAAFIGWFGATHFGILGITIVLIAGLVLLLFVRLPKHTRT